MKICLEMDRETDHAGKVFNVHIDLELYFYNGLEQFLKVRQKRNAGATASQNLLRNISKICLTTMYNQKCLSLQTLQTSSQFYLPPLPRPPIPLPPHIK